MLLVSIPEIWTLGHTRLAEVSCRWIPSSVARPSDRDTVRSPPGTHTITGFRLGGILAYQNVYFLLAVTMNFQ